MSNEELAVKRMKGLRELLGYVQNGSDTTVKIFQDDATYTFHVKVGSRLYWGDTFEQALDAAIADLEEL